MSYSPNFEITFFLKEESWQVGHCPCVVSTASHRSQSNFKGHRAHTLLYIRQIIDKDIAYSTGALGVYGSDGKESACNAGDLGLIPGLGRSPGGGHGNPL